MSLTDQNTRWTFRATSRVEVDSPIVYLGDLVQPDDRSLAAWKRLVRSPVGLVPIDGTPMKIRRERLVEAIRAAEATPAWIDIVGPDQIEVVYHDERQHDMSRHLAEAPQAGSELRTSSASAARPSAAFPVQQASGYRSQRPRAESETPTRIDPGKLRRLVYWISRSIEQQHPHVAESYRVEVPEQQPAFASLADVTSISSVEFIDPVQEGNTHIKVAGLAQGSSVETALVVVLEPHRLAVAARTMLRRGHRITDSDLEKKPVPDEQWKDYWVTDPEFLIGMEVASSVRAGQLVRRRDVQKPILVRRGDLVEVRVIGEGVRVTANARSLDQGGARDLVQVETLDPRRKLVARVVEPGLVEVITRAPRLSQ